MAYIRTRSIIEGLSAQARSIQMSDGGHMESFAALFDHVATYDSPDLMQALADLLVIEANSVCLIIPGRERYKGDAVPGRPVLRQRIVEITVLLALRDVDYAPYGAAASTEVPEFQQIMQVKDALSDALDANPSLGLAGVCLYPVDGGPEDIRDEANPDHRLWRAWIARYETPAGVSEYDNDTLVF